MRLFDENGNMPSGVRMVIEQLLKNVAPEMAKDVDVIATTVASFKAQMDRIEANQAAILKALEPANARPLGRGPEIDHRPANGAGKQARS